MNFLQNELLVFKTNLGVDGDIQVIHTKIQGSGDFCSNSYLLIHKLQLYQFIAMTLYKKKEYIFIVSELHYCNWSLLSDCIYIV